MLGLACLGPGGTLGSHEHHVHDVLASEGPRGTWVLVAGLLLPRPAIVIILQDITTYRSHIHRNLANASSRHTDDLCPGLPVLPGWSISAAKVLFCHPCLSLVAGDVSE